MFTHKVNAACNNALFSRWRILAMSKIHPSIASLYAAAKLRGHESPAMVARALNISAQRLQNWEERGISKEGALAAQKLYGADANALLDGEFKPPAPRASATDDEAGNLRRQVESLTVVLASLVGITAKHRPLEGEELVRLIRGNQSLDLAQHDLVADILDLAGPPKGASAKPTARARKRSPS